MTRQIVLESPTVNRRQPLLGENGSSGERRRVGEVAGGTAAECAAIWCCCPCTVMNLLVLAVYKVPTGLCRKAWKKNKRHRNKKKKALLQPQQPKPGRDSSSGELEAGRIESDVGDMTSDGSTAALDFETEMWDRFHGTGFWRSPSQRDP